LAWWVTTQPAASGSFYTPEVLVQLILERAVGPLVAERRAAFEARAAALSGDTRPKAERLAALRDLDPATRLLDLKICDPAMGSGHFLVSLVDYLADRVLLAVLRIEEITDADIAEVRDSASTFVDVKQATEPLSAFLSLLEGERMLGVLDAAPRERPRESRRAARHETRLAAWERAQAFNHILDGSFGDPVAIARGEMEILPRTSPEQLGLMPPPTPEQSSLFPGSAIDSSHRGLAQAILDNARELARQHRFTHWQLAFPNIWRDWSGAEPQGGFDAVIGNPPYVRHEQLGALKPALAKAYRAFDGVADLYVYFYELGLRLLRPGGLLSFVVTNKWLRAGYADRLRGLFGGEAWLEAVIDFGHAKRFFPAADVFPCVVVARRPNMDEPPVETAACQIPRDLVRLDRVSEQVAELSFPLPRTVFTRGAWVIERLNHV
jgi:hypothetical protein